MDAEQLQQIESSAVFVHLLELDRQPIIGNFDLAHLQAIHRALFQDVYDWAGEIRQIDISKGASRFAHFGYIVSNAQTLFAQLAKEHHLRGTSLDTFAQRAAFFLGEINVLHPFREGNGRAQRVFFDDLARAAAYKLDWSLISQQQMIDASITSLLRGDNSGFVQIFRAIVSPVSA